MNKLTTSIILAVILCQSAFAQGINFDQSTSWAAIQEKAKKENKLIFLDFYATWCKPCKIMDQQVYNQMEVGDVINKDFISVKIQTDKTDKDSASIKSWYADAAKLAKRYNVTALPTLLFVKADGTVLNSKIGGSSDVSKFIASAKEALNPAMHYEKMKADFTSGKLDIAKYTLLENKAQSAGEQAFSLQVQKAYKAKFFDKMNEKGLLKPEHLAYLFSHPHLMNSKDRIFRITFSHPEKIDSTMKDRAAQFISQVITKEEITDKLWKNEQPITLSPDWKAIEVNIQQKYGQQYVDELLFNQQYAFYYRTGDWKSLIKLINDRAAQFPIKANDVGRAWEFNQYAWDFFSVYNDKEALTAALKWVDMAINAIGDENAEVHNFYDTKANLLHKLGRTPDAIELEKKAITLKIKLGGGMAEYWDTLEKMQKGLPTWE